MIESVTEVAQKMLTPGMGILAADESTTTIAKRFAAIGVESTPQTRCAYREMLFTAEPAMRDHISGVILFDETIRQLAADGRPFTDVITASGAVPGIKIDKGAKPLAGHPGETVTEGLDGLRERLSEYAMLGARFAKWRAVIGISDILPTAGAVKANAHALARYAALCQESGLVPIVEPEVQMDGASAEHDARRCYEVTEQVLREVFAALYEARVVLEGIVLKPNMIVAGKGAGRKPAPEEVAELTVKCLKSAVPAAVPGVTFLSGGQSEVEATRHLSLMNQLRPLPWVLTFSYGRALQASALKAWGGDVANKDACQKVFSHRARMNGLAARGQWSPESEAAST